MPNGPIVRAAISPLTPAQQGPGRSREVARPQSYIGFAWFRGVSMKRQNHPPYDQHRLSSRRGTNLPKTLTAVELHYAPLITPCACPGGVESNVTALRSDLEYCDGVLI